MIAIANTLVSESIVEKKFLCDLNACKGACCVAGESGAPLEKKELLELKEAYPFVKPYMTAEGIASIEKNGVFVIDTDGDDTTPLVDGKHCAFVYFENEIALCSIEKAWKEKKILFQKPISCHLYPIRITSKKNYDEVNYQKWNVCKPACKCGAKQDIPIYKFVKSALIRKYGKKWYSHLERAATLLIKKRKDTE
jgi:hypothetical protein